MDKMKMQTPDLTAENIEKIGALFPNCITETADENGHIKKAINFDMLRQMLSDDVAEGDEAYEFTWVGKKASIVEANKPIRKTLRPCKDESVNWDTTENLYIEGDNLEVLKLLQESYLGKVKMIYIDPPYNTGNDFIYNDDFKMDSDEYADEIGEFDEDGNRMFKNTETNGRFHSDWCSMMYPRLMLARNLLSDDGVIFISIDDNEQENLKKICDEVFGAENFVSQLVWEKKKKGAFLSKNYINMKEYIIVYAKHNAFFNGLVGEINFLSETYPCIKTTNARGIRIIRKGTVSKYKEKNYTIPAGTIISSGNMELIYLDELIVSDGILQSDVTIDSNWIYSQETLDKFANEKLLYITQDNYIRRIVNDYRVKMLKDILLRVGTDGKSLPNYTYSQNLNEGGWGTNEDANDELHKILEKQYLFEFSKPCRLIGKLIQSVTNKNNIVLDFFSGSSTTAHAVMQLNAMDGGNRKFIMVQLPEPCEEKSETYKAGYKNICEIGKERIRRAGAKIKHEIEKAAPFERDEKETGLAAVWWNDEAIVYGKSVAEKFDAGFRVLKLDTTNMTDVYYSPLEINQQMLLEQVENIKPDRTDLDLLFGCLLDWGIPLNMPYVSETIDGCTVHTYNEGDLIACFDKNIPESVIKIIAKRQPLRAVFRDSSFADSPSKINVGEIFKMIAPDTRVKVI